LNFLDLQEAAEAAQHLNNEDRPRRRVKEEEDEEDRVINFSLKKCFFYGEKRLSGCLFLERDICIRTHKTTEYEVSSKTNATPPLSQSRDVWRINLIKYNTKIGQFPST
jgi:hypothetical protein